MAQESNLIELLESGVQHHQRGDLAAAQDCYRRVLAQAPEHPDALHLLGLIGQAAGDFALAEANIQRALKVRPQEAVFHYNLANVLRDAGRFDDAIASYRAALGLRPDDADTLLNLGSTLAAHGDPSAAADCYRTLLRQVPQHVSALLSLGEVLRSLGEDSEARAAYQTVLTIEAENCEAHVGLAVLSQEAGKEQAAQHHYQAALRANPDSAPAWNNLGTWHQERGERAAAADCYQRALTLDAADAQAYNNLGTLFAEEDRAAEAEACYRAALQIRPEFAEAHKNRAAVLQALGRRDEALQSLRAALRLQPGLAEAAYKLAALSGEHPPASAPAEYVAALFDGYARDYEQHLTSTLRYQVPEALFELLVQTVPHAHELDVLDLGCGTGLSGAVLRPRARRLTGIDLSPRMLARARERGIYDRLLEGDIVQLLAGEPVQFDLAVAADVFVYIGDLEPVMESLTRVLRPGAWLAFSVETLEAGEYRLQPTGRYAHASAYLGTLARRHGFTPLVEREVTLRVEQGNPVAGQLQLWRWNGKGEQP